MEEYKCSLQSWPVKLDEHVVIQNRDDRKLTLTPILTYLSRVDGQNC